MQCLFDSSGRHIANSVNGQLHLPSGRNIGHFLREQKIFIDREGNYLGEVVQQDFLMRNPDSPHLDRNFGVQGDYGNIGLCGNPSLHAALNSIDGYEDIDFEKFEDSGAYSLK
jgi:hypothetical protein